jgi:hypothetical protein
MAVKFTTINGSQKVWMGHDGPQPRLLAPSHGQSAQARCDTQMSLPPSPPGRFEVK